MGTLTCTDPSLSIFLVTALLCKRQWLSVTAHKWWMTNQGMHLVWFLHCLHTAWWDRLEAKVHLRTFKDTRGQQHGEPFLSSPISSDAVPFTYSLGCHIGCGNALTTLYFVTFVQFVHILCRTSGSAQGRGVIILTVAGAKALDHRRAFEMLSAWVCVAVTVILNLWISGVCLVNQPMYWQWLLPLLAKLSEKCS